MNARRFFALAALVLMMSLTLILSGCNSPTPPPSSSAPPPVPLPSATTKPSTTTAPAKKPSGAGHVIVIIKDGSYSPDKVTIKVGTQVVWQNGGKNLHVVAFDNGSLTSPQIKAGDVAGHTFTKTGVYPYHDALYPQMKGEVTVK